MIDVVAIKYNMIINMDIDNDGYDVEQHVILKNIGDEDINYVVFQSPKTIYNIETTYQYVVENDKLVIELPTSYVNEQMFDIQIKYKAKLPKSLYWGDLFYEFSEETEWYLYLDNKNIYCSEYDVSIDAPEKYIVRGTGLEENNHFIANNIRYFGLIITEKMPVADKYIDGIRISIFYFKDNFILAHNIIKEVENVLKFYINMIGFFPYPFLIISPGSEDYMGGCNLASGMTQFHNMKGTTPNFPDDNWIISHEIAHHYFGEYVCHSDKTTWLWLGLGLSLDYEYTKTCKKSISKYKSLSNKLKTALDYGIAIIKLTDNDRFELEKSEGYEFNFYNVAVLHGKSFFIMQDIKNILGEDTFFEILHIILNIYAGKILKTKDFIELIKEETKTDVYDMVKELLTTNKCPKSVEQFYE